MSTYRVTHHFSADRISDGTGNASEIEESYRNTLREVLNADDRVISYNFRYGSTADVEVGDFDTDEEGINDEWFNACVKRGF